MAARDDKRAVYLNTPGLRIGRKEATLTIKDPDKLIDEVRLADVSHVALFGNIQISTQAIQSLCDAEIPLTYFSGGGWFYGLTQGHGLKNVFLRIQQFQSVTNPVLTLKISRAFVHGKIRNHRTLLMRNHVEPNAAILHRLRRAAKDALEAESLPQLLGIEGAAAAAYFEEFSGMLKASGTTVDVEESVLEPDLYPNTDTDTDTDSPDADTSSHASIPGTDPNQPTRNPTNSSQTTPETSGASNKSPFVFHFTQRSRRPPKDPINALLSLAYSLLSKDCTIAAYSVGFDPYVGFYHQPRFGRPALALDLMEEFRPLIAESAVLTAVNTRMITPDHFVQAGDAVNLTPVGRKKFFLAYEQRMNALLTHPLFDYKVSYRRALELQARILAKTLTGEIPEYIPLTTR
jgi:CRISPR-associated protein Cas1